MGVFRYPHSGVGSLRSQQPRNARCANIVAKEQPHTILCTDIFLYITNMLDKEFSYYLEHQDELLKKYNNRFVVIIGENVVGSYDSHQQALFQTKKTHKLGSFLIQKCTEGEAAYTMTFHSRVSFA
jgi:hypothetical protein